MTHDENQLASSSIATIILTIVSKVIGARKRQGKSRLPIVLYLLTVLTSAMTLYRAAQQKPDSQYNDMKVGTILASLIGVGGLVWGTSGLAVRAIK